MKNSTFAVGGATESIGAVAINGGIGLVVPYGADTYRSSTNIIDTVATRSAEVIANIKANAHITLGELKKKIADVGTQKLPTFNALMNAEPVPVAERQIGEGKITVFDSGFAVYEQGGYRTVMAVNRCGGYRYDFADSSSYVPAEVFEEMEWGIRLVMEGERRLEVNRHIRSAEMESHMEETDMDYMGAVMVDFFEEDNAQILADQELKRLYAAIGKLTERQQEIIQLYYFKGMTQDAVAEELGITQRAVGYHIEGALKKLKKVF